MIERKIMRVLLLWLCVFVQPERSAPFILSSQNFWSCKIQNFQPISCENLNARFQRCRSLASRLIKACAASTNIAPSHEFRAADAEIPSIPDDDKIAPYHPSRLLGERVEMTIANIRRREKIFEKYAEDIQGKTGLGAVAALQYVEGLIERRDYVWGDLVMIVMKRKPGEVENIVLRTTRDILQPPIKESEWRWFRDNLLSTFVWFAPSMSSKGKFLYEHLLDIAAENIQIQARLVDKLRYPILEEADVGGMFLSGGEDACRQDHPSVGLGADLSAEVAERLSAEDRRFYDVNVYLNKLVCIARILDPEFQAAVADVFAPLAPLLVLQPGPPKSLARCRAKAQADYAQRRWPTAAQLLDPVRCTVTCRDSHDLLGALRHLLHAAPPPSSDDASASSSPLAVVRVKNGFRAGPGGARGRGYRDVKVGLCGGKLGCLQVAFGYRSHPLPQLLIYARPAPCPASGNSSSERLMDTARTRCLRRLEAASSA